MKNTGIQWTCFVVKKKLTQQCKSIMPHKINFKNRKLKHIIIYTIDHKDEKNKPVEGNE